MPMEVVCTETLAHLLMGLKNSKKRHTSKTTIKQKHANSFPRKDFAHMGQDVDSFIQRINRQHQNRRKRSERISATNKFQMKTFNKWESECKYQTLRIKLQLISTFLILPDCLYLGNWVIKSNNINCLNKFSSILQHFLNL